MGKFIISLDFELHWGSVEKWDLNYMKSYFLNTRESIPHVLSIFENSGIKATWATVGYLFAKDKEQLLSFTPLNRPLYNNFELSSYNIIDSIGNNETEDPFHYAYSIISKILNTNGQEIASHTFSHFYCNEFGQTANQFEEDLKSAQLLARENFGIQLKSLVFPRNQFNSEYVNVAANAGFKVVRSNPNIWVWKDTKGKLVKFARAVDTLVSISKPLSFRNEDIKTSNSVTLLPSSRFLRPYKSNEKLIQNTKIIRIRNEMTYAAKNNRNYHIWWHPHNFGNDVLINLNQLKEIIRHYHFLNKKYGFESANMADFELLL